MTTTTGSLETRLGSSRANAITDDPDRAQIDLGDTTQEEP